ncbi:Hypothetical protein SRAE_0000055500 [Strongyloides ratti]|uniref:HTH_48 domain-containing protein n=1 Tax=Strongyloides ratti TaxID=34506 RepID=A0A090KVI0_STRRB|nr:Hypothetical protein SRAE_0000055500 [Strongyloides ratti]CEF61431.1 Hypothetical protein SRAE_0000055500 [Strongyloides ratti]
MSSKNDIHIIFLYEFKRETKVTETARNINAALGENLVTPTTVQRWFIQSRRDMKVWRTKTVEYQLQLVKSFEADWKDKKARSMNTP